MKLCIKTLAVLLAIFVIGSMTAMAENDNANAARAVGTKWVSGDYTCVQVSDSTAAIKSFNGKVGNVTVPEEIDGVRIVSIMDHAFYENASLQSVTLPDGIESIGAFAFGSCKRLSKVTLPEGLTMIDAGAFISCQALKKLELPSTVTTIGEGVIANCLALNSITVAEGNTAFAVVDGALISLNDHRLIAMNPTAKADHLVIPDVVEVIDQAAFFSCRKLKNITIPDSVKEIHQMAFYGCSGLKSVEIPASVTTIEDDTFVQCTALTSVMIPDSVTSIGESAFAGSALTEIVLPQGISAIEKYTFSGCKKLKSISIPASVTSIGKQAFSDCTALQSVELPEGLTSIGDYAFAGCRNLKEVTLPFSLTQLGYLAFQHTTVYTLENSEFNTKLLQYNNKLKYLDYPLSESDFQWQELPDGTVEITGYHGRTAHLSIPATIDGKTVTQISSNAFYDNYGIYSVVIPQGVTSIDSYAFCGCQDITSMELPQSLQSIGENAFGACSFTKITIPAGVTSIGRTPFFVVTQLEEIIVDKDNPAYASVNGILFTKDGTTLLCYPPSKKGGSYNVPEGVTTLPSFAFVECNNLGMITLPKTLTSIEKRAIDSCRRMNEIKVAKGNDALRVDQGVLYYGTTLMYCPPLRSGKTITVAEGTTAIADSALFACKNLTSVTIPDSVTYIGQSVFALWDKATVYTTEGSTAWQYCQENNIPVQAVE